MTFGDSDAVNANLIALVRAGKKTATCSKASDFEDRKEELPKVGQREIVTQWDGTPAVVIETLSVERMRFDDIGEGFSLAEGENQTHAGWHEDHRAYFERNGGWAADMDMICERFRVVEDLTDRESAK
ncbi:MAG: ASCH domain-containing protein [Halocynthiibacter sp.]